MHVNVNLIDEKVIRINGEITINADVHANDTFYVRKIIFGILLHVVVKMVNV